jgi:hypothetical protein
MPSKITVRYFQVSLAPNAVLPFSDALRQVNELPVNERTRELGGVGFRLESFDEVGNFIRGQMTRIQDDNLPAIVTEEGLIELDVGELGYGSAFVFDIQQSVLAMQYNPQIVTPGRLGQYLRAFGDHAKYQFLAIPGQDVWQTFSDGNITSFRVKVANPRNLQMGMPGEMGNSIGALANAYAAPFVTVSLGVGHQKITLSDALKDVARAFLGMENVQSMSAKVEDMPEKIDLMSQMLHDKDSIEIPSDPSESYQVRRNFVESNYRAQRGYIQQFLADVG